MLLLLALLACSSGDEPCESPECLEEQVVGRYGQDPEAATADLAAVDDPTVQQGIALALLEAYPGQTDGVCEVLRDPSARRFCLKARERPHLWARPKPQVTEGRTAPGPLEARLTFPPGTVSRFAELAAADPAELGCSDAEDTACLMAAAEARAAEEPAAAAEVCQAMAGSERWRDECFFKAGETAGLAAGPDEYALVMELCAAAGSFADNCAGHVTTRKALALAVTACKGDPSAMAELQPWAAAVSDAWAPRGEAHRQAAVGRFWSAALGRALAVAPGVSGDYADHLPPEALPHLRAATAARLMVLEGPPGTRDLEGWVARLGEVLATRSGPVEAWSCRGAQANSRPDWPIDRDDADRALPAVIYRVSSRRVWSEDPAVDAHIVILQALAGEPAEVAAPLLQEGQAHPHALVSWTATRLLEDSRPVPPEGAPRSAAPPRK